MSEEDPAFRTAVFSRVFETLKGFAEVVSATVAVDGAEVSVAFESVNVSLGNIPGRDGADKPFQTDTIGLKYVFREADRTWVPAMETSADGSLVGVKGVAQAAALVSKFQAESLEALKASDPDLFLNGFYAAGAVTGMSLDVTALLPNLTDTFPGVRINGLVVGSSYDPSSGALVQAVNLGIGADQPLGDDIRGEVHASVAKAVFGEANVEVDSAGSVRIRFAETGSFIPLNILSAGENMMSFNFGPLLSFVLGTPQKVAAGPGSDRTAVTPSDTAARSASARNSVSRERRCTLRKRKTGELYMKDGTKVVVDDSMGSRMRRNDADA